MEPFRQLRSRIVVMPRPDIDTDQIIPARFLKGTTRTGLGRHLFSEWRSQSDCPLDKPESRGAQVLVAGPNFGCGSSREHAPWALLDYGFRAVISSSIADIFRGNALKNGLLPVVLDEYAHRRLLGRPGAEIEIDLQACTVTCDGLRAPFPIDPFARRCLLEGTDELGFLLAQSAQIEAHEGKGAQ